MPEPRSALVSTSRADAAPIAEASRRSVNWIQCAVGGCAGLPARGRGWRACSAKARRAVRSPTMRSASAQQVADPHAAAPVAGGQAAAAARTGRGTVPRAGVRRRLGRQRIETSSRPVTLASSDQNVPWVSGSQPTRPNSCCGRSQPMPNGPVCDPAGIQPAGTRQRRQQQGVGPDQRSRPASPAIDAAPAGAAPVQPADQRRRELRHRGERQQAVGRPGRVAGRGRGSRRRPSAPAARWRRDAPTAPRRGDAAARLQRAGAQQQPASTRSLLTIVASATLATITMPVAAEKPPM